MRSYYEVDTELKAAKAQLASMPKIDLRPANLLETTAITCRAYIDLLEWILDGEYKNDEIPAEPINHKARVECLAKTINNNTPPKQNYPSPMVVVEDFVLNAIF